MQSVITYRELSLLLWCMWCWSVYVLLYVVVLLTFLVHMWCVYYIIIIIIIIICQFLGSFMLPQALRNCLLLSGFPIRYLYTPRFCWLHITPLDCPSVIYLRKKTWDLYSSPTIVVVIKSRIMRWGACGTYGVDEACTGFVWETWGKETTGETQA
jgi:hypothetical protein